MKRLCPLAVFLAFLIMPTLAANTNSLEGILTAAGSVGATSYYSYSGLEGAAGSSTSSNYANYLGQIYATPTAQTSTAVAAADTTAPTIANVQFDGATILAGDYVDSSAVITAIVSDSASSIDLSQSSVKVDTASTAFSSLSGDSSYNATTCQLTYKISSLASGDHTLTLAAYDAAGNSVSTSLSFKTESGGAGISGTVLNYPNPFNPNTQTTQIGYELTKDAMVTIYLFNVLGQRIWQRDFAAGADGGRAGYNKVTWDGYSDFGVMAANDVYLCRIISDGKVIGKCKIAVLK